MAGFIDVYFYRSETYMYFISLICKDLFEKKIKCETNKSLDILQVKRNFFFSDPALT